MKIKCTLFFSIILLSNLIFSVAQEPVIKYLKNFNSLYVNGNIKVEIYPSDSPGIGLVVKNTSPDNIVYEIKDFTLNLRLKTNTPKDADVIIKVYYKILNEIFVTSGAFVISDIPIKGKAITFIARMGGKIDLQINMSSLEASVSLGSVVTVSGNVQKQIVNTATGGIYSAYQLESADTHVKASTGATAKVIAGRLIDATASLGGSIGYKGNPVSTYFKTNLGGEIKNYDDDRKE